MLEVPPMLFHPETVPEYSGLPSSVVSLLVIVTGIAAVIGSILTRP
jgi:hypothetical protein